jgi:hypothetical protein
MIRLIPIGYPSVVEINGVTEPATKLISAVNVWIIGAAFVKDAMLTCSANKIDMTTYL